MIADNTYSVISHNQVPGWMTTAPDQRIEIWRAPFGAVPPGSGKQFVEVNANHVATLYQDVATTPGQTLRWELQHRGRLGTDVAAVRIGPPGVDGAVQAEVSNGPTRWGTHAGEYVVPAGQMTTRFAVRSVSATGSSPGNGNFLDSVSFGTGACLLSSASVSAPVADVGDVVTYTFSATNEGGNPARTTVLADELPADVSFVPGSIRVTHDGVRADISDARDSDVGEYDAVTRTVTARVGGGATATTGGQIAPGTNVSVSYQVRIEVAAAGRTLVNDAAVSFIDPLSGQPSTSISDTANVAVHPAADLAVGVDRLTDALVAGQLVVYRISAGNTGPSAATDANMTIQFPSELSELSIVATDSTCEITTSAVTCALGTLAPGASRAVTLTGLVPGDTASGAPVGVTAQVSSSILELNPTDNTATVFNSVATSADVNVGLTYAPTSPVAGEEVTYTARVTNSGPSTARNVVLTDPVPTGSTLVTADVSGGSCTSTTSGTVECTLPDLVSGASINVAVILRLAPDGTGAVNNAVSITSSTPDADATNNTASVRTPGGAVADLEVDLDIDQDRAHAGESVGYRLTVTNHGPSSATNVSFNTVVPPGIVITRPDTPFCTPTACTLPQLDPGETIEITGTAHVSPDAKDGAGRAVTSVISPTTDPDPSNNTDAVEFAVLLESDLAISHEIGAASGRVIAGERFSEVLRVVNDGPTRAEQVLVEVIVPTGYPVPTIAPAGGTCAFHGTVGANGVSDGGIYRCTRATLISGGTWQITADIQMPAGFVDSEMTLNRIVSTASPDPDAANNRIETDLIVTRHSSVTVTQITSTPQVVQGDEVHFRARITNTGPSDARDVLVVDSPSDGLALQSMAPSLGTYNPSSGLWQIPWLAVGDVAELQIVAAAHTSGELTNTVSVNPSVSGDPHPIDDTATTTVLAIPAAPSLALSTSAIVSPGDGSATDADPVADLDDNIRFRYLVTNTGNVPLASVTVTETLAPPVTCPSDTLAVEAAMTCTGDAGRRVTQADIDAGRPIASAATATGLPRDSLTPTSIGPVETAVPVSAASPALSASLSGDWDDADGDGHFDAGETILWTVAIHNNGNVTLSALEVTGLRGLSCGSTRLIPGTHTTCAAIETLSDHMAAAGTRTAATTATATASRTGQRLTDTATATIVASPADPAALDAPQALVRTGSQALAILAFAGLLILTGVVGRTWSGSAGGRANRTSRRIH